MRDGMGSGRMEPGETQAGPAEGWKLYAGFVLLCLLVTLVRLLWAGSSNDWTGADSLFYAVLGRNLAEGRGFVADYIRFFFTRYETVANRPEDWLSPLFPLSMVPFVRLWGDTFLAYSAPSILAGSLGLPLAVRALAYQLGGSRWVALAAGLTALFHPMLFLGSQQPMSDVPFTLLVTVCLYWFVRTSEGFAPAVAAGFFLGLAALTRPVAVWLFPVLPFCHALRVRRLRGLVAPEMMALLGAAVLTMTPWLLRNKRLFGNPMYSIYHYQGPLAGRSDATIGDSYNFWWDRPLPTMADRYGGQPLGQALGYVLKYVVWGLDMTFVGLIKSANVTATVGLGQYNYHLYQSALGLPALVALWRRRQTWQAQATLLVTFSLILAIAVMNIPASPRYFFSSYPLIIVYGWLGWGDTMRRRRLSAAGQARAVGLVLALLVLVGAGLDWVRGSRMQLPYDPAGREKRLAQRELILNYAQQVPADALILAGVHPGALSLFGRRAAVAVPAGASPTELRQVIRHYRITHAIVPEPQAELLRSWGWRVTYQRPPVQGLVRPQEELP